LASAKSRLINRVSFNSFTSGSIFKGHGEIMMHETEATIIGFAGVALLLLAFLLNLVRQMRSDGYPYAALNFVGAALACYSSFLISFMPFVVLEGVWALAAAGAIVQKAFARSTAVG
jgi:hypothetical protein